MRSKFKTRKQKYTHIAKVAILASVLLPTYAGLLSLGAIAKVTLKAFGVSNAPPKA